MSVIKTLNTIEDLVNHATASMTTEEVEQRLYFLTNTIAPTEETVKLVEALRQQLNTRLNSQAD